MFCAGTMGESDDSDVLSLVTMTGAKLYREFVRQIAFFDCLSQSNFDSRPFLKLSGTQLTTLLPQGF
jgi:hypothetical protein